MYGKSGAAVKVIGTVAAALLTAALFLPGAAAADLAGAEAPLPDADPEVVEMVVTGLSCPFCAFGLEKRLRSDIEELSELQMEAGTGKVAFRIGDGSKYTDNDLREIVKNAGFDVKELDRKPDAGGNGPRR